MMIALNLYISQILLYKAEGLNANQIMIKVIDQFNLKSTELINQIFNYINSI